MSDTSDTSSMSETPEVELPAAAIDLLVSKVVAKFTRGEISLDEAALRLLGTGRYEEKPEAVLFLRDDVCPRLEEQLRGLEDEMAKLQLEADRIRGVLGVGAPAIFAHAVAPMTNSSAHLSGKSKKEKAQPEKKRKGAQSDHPSENHGESPSDNSGEAWTSEAADTLDSADSEVSLLEAGDDEVAPT